MLPATHCWCTDGAAHRKLAYDAYWDHLMKRAPEPTKELKALSDALR